MEAFPVFTVSWNVRIHLFLEASPIFTVCWDVRVCIHIFGSAFLNRPDVREFFLFVFSNQVKSSQVNSSQVNSIQFKSNQINFYFLGCRMLRAISYAFFILFLWMSYFTNHHMHLSLFLGSIPHDGCLECPHTLVLGSISHSHGGLKCPCMYTHFWKHPP